MTKFRWTRLARGGVIALVLAAAMAAPVAAAPPARTVGDLHPFVIPAGRACAFDVEGRPSWGFRVQTVFSDGRVQSSVRAHGAYVNLATGATFPTADNFRELDRIDPETGFLVGEANGQTTSSFGPGDTGPFGLVTGDGALYRFVGSVSFTYDPNTNVFNVVAYTGTVTDVCAALS